MLTKARKKMTKPSWMGEAAWTGLQDYWKTDAFKKTSSQNKSNRSSSRGGAVHTTGRTAHLEVARRLVCIIFYFSKF